MKSFLLFFQINLLILLAFGLNTHAQNNCMYPHETSHPWTYIPNFDGADSYINVNEYQSNSNNNASYWFQGSFTIDMWLRPSWPNDAGGDNWYTAFGAGPWGDDYNCFIIIFEKHNSDYRLRISDGIDAGSNADLIYNISYADDWKDKWKHIAVTYDDQFVKLYIDGEYKAQQQFVFNTIPYWHCVLGGHDNHTWDFRGLISGFRVWTDICMSANEVNYIYDKTFHEEGTFADDYQDLFEHLKINMYTSETNIYSLVPEKSMVEHGIERTSWKHPARPPRPYNLAYTNNCESISLNWTRGFNNTTHYIYRKKSGDSDSTLLCRTYETSYVDSDPNLEPGIDYIYTVASVWQAHQHNPLGLPDLYYHSCDNPQVTARVQMFAAPQNLLITEDANTNNNCNGQVKLQWEHLNPMPDYYYLHYKVENGSWTDLASNITNNTYTHNVDNNDFGKTISYRVDAAGDGCINFSSSITGVANHVCSTSPTGVVSAEQDGNIIISWDFTDSGAPASHFRIYRNEDGGEFLLLEENINVDLREFIDYSASICKQYRYKIEAYNHCGASGSTSAQSNATILPADFSNVFTFQNGTETESYCDASKGYFNNKITLEWSVNPNQQGNIESFEIFRRKENQAFTFLTSIDNNNSTYYEDLAAEPNILYEYLIRSTADCAGTILTSDSIFTTGFRTTTGIVAGKITFAGGNVVPNVEIVAQSDELNIARSLHFNGTQFLSGMQPTAELFNPGLTVECWIKPENMPSAINGIISVNSGMLFMGLKNMKPYVGLLNAPQSIPGASYLMQIEADTILNTDSWYNLSVTYSPFTGIVKLFLNGDLIGNSIVNPEDQWIPDVPYVDMLVGKIYGENSYWRGNIDEMRIWNYEKTGDEIRRDYRRILVGNEEYLRSYYRFDEGFGIAAYDISRIEQEFNKNDMDMISDPNVFPEWSTQIPSYEQLRPAGISDANGNYIISGIIYSAGGNIYEITPLLGVHEFDPNNINLFIGDNSPVHNNVDFTDISSFRVTGNVYYQNTNFPVKDAQVYVNNQQIFNEGGNAVLTDQYGGFDIQVPIGQNYISVRKNNHEFAYNGQWPHPTSTNDFPKHDFQEDVFGLEFYDITRVKLAGKFVGGDVEGNKILGFGLSNNNIGVGTIELENEQGFDIDFNDPESNTNVISFTTDTLTGEYEVFLLPEMYKINSAGNDYYSINENDLGMLDLRQIPLADTTYHTVSEEEIIEEDTVINTNTYEYWFHFRRDFIVYTEPTIFVYGENIEPLIGENEVVVQTPGTEETDTLNLIENSPFNYPFFEMGKAYDIIIKLSSLYTNYDDAEPIIDTVLVSDATVTIANNLEVNQPVWQLETNDQGIVDTYTWFRVGLPNMIIDETEYEKSYTKTMTITAQHNDYTVQWEGNEDGLFRAYVLGGVDADGQNFVTYGPELPQFILRDPPGNNSYTFLEEGSGFVVSEDYNFNFGGGSETDLKFLKGARFQVGGGLAGPVVLAETKTTYNAGLATTNYVNKSGSLTTAYQFNQRFSTSDAPTAVGSMADVYIGKSYNLFFTQTRNIRILPKDYCVDVGTEYLEDDALNNPGTYTLGKIDGFAVTEDESATMFIYSQDHIVNSLIPNYLVLIQNLLANSPDYTSQIPAEHPYYGTSNDNAVWQDTIASTGNENPSYIYSGPESEVDSIAWMNQQISIWMQTIALNEKAKVEADELVENISFDGNAGAYTNQITYTATDKERTNYKYSFKVFGGSEFGFSFNGFGFLTTTNMYKEWEREIGFETEETRSMTWGYVLDDDNMSDYYSVNITQDSEGVLSGDMEEFLNIENQEDFSSFHTSVSVGSSIYAAYGVILGKAISSAFGTAFSIGSTILWSAIYLSEMDTYRDDINDAESSELVLGLCGSSPIFRIQGGRSACPYEGPEYTFTHLNPNNNEPYIIHQGTQQREAPKIEIEPQTVINVPEGEQAVFTLKLTNESITGHDFTYMLKMDEASNPDGAMVRIDGLGTNRPFFVPAGTTISKTLTVEQGASGALEYNNLQLIFHSECQYDPSDNFPDIADSLQFSAVFIPVCSNVAFGNMEDNWVINNEDENTKTVHITGYNVNYPTFKRIIFQYQQAGSTPSTVMNFFNDPIAYAEFDGPKMLIDGQSDIFYEWDISALNDGEYNLILKTICGNGSENQSEILSGTIDRINPRPFGTPQPSDGILSYGEDISIKFNETINAGELYAIATNINLSAITNGTDLTHSEYLIHDANILFDGENNHLLVNPGVNLDFTSFTIEFWAKRMASGRECLLSLNTNDNEGLWIGFSEDDKFVVELEGQTLESYNMHTGPGSWNHYAVIYNQGDETTDPGVTIVVSFGVTTEERYQSMTYYGTLEGPLYIGYCPYDQSAFTGNMHDLRIWNTYKTVGEISSNKGVLLSGYEQGLYGYWPMNEATGDKAYDIAFGRDAIVNATWQVSRDGKSLAFDGSSYAIAQTGSMVFDETDDFSFEFWFKTSVPSSEVCFFSNGTGTSAENQHSWLITANHQGNITITNNDNSIIIDASNYLNNQWQHFALCLNRIGYINVYINGELVATRSSTDFRGFGASQMVLGARYVNEFSSEYYDKFFTGYIDELRVWNNFRKAEHIKQYMNYALTGNEIGIKAYFPFEDTRIADPSVSNETLENLTYNNQAISEDFILEQNTSFSNISPNIKLYRPEVNIPFTYVINNDEVMITPNIDDNLIENRILNIGIQNVKDMFGNKMSSSVNWTAFVDRNNVVWDVDELSIEKEIDEEFEISVIIRNKAGNPDNYVIENIPEWMDVSPQSGNLDPLESEEISIIIKPELNVGVYDHDLELVSSMNYNERLGLKVKVKGNLPEWNVDINNYQHSANLIGQLKINNIISVDTEDIVGCFVGNECRGVANVEFIESANLYLVFMNINSNQMSGEQISFKVYDASTGNIYSNVNPVMDFIANNVYGTIEEPIDINALDFIEQHFSLNQGWNWISFNIFSPVLNNINSMLTELNASPRDLIKNATNFAQYTRHNYWAGSLMNLNYIDGYKLYLNEPQDFFVTGRKVIADSVSIPLYEGWNFIGFPSQTRIPLMNALSYSNPANNDIIKSQHKFAVYNDLIGWIGSLTYLEPGQSYMIRLSNPGMFKSYSGKNISMIQTIEEQEPNIQLPATQTNMSMIINTDFNCTEQTKIFAYNNGEVCGYAEAIDIGNGVFRFFITVNSVSEQDITFKAENNNKQFLALEVVKYSEDAHIGTLDDPFVLTFERIDQIDSNVQIYPNPFKNRLRLNLTSYKEQRISVSVYSILSIKLFEKHINLKSGLNEIDLYNTLGLNNIGKGVYFVKFKLSDKEYNLKIVKN